MGGRVGCHVHAIPSTTMDVVVSRFTCEAFFETRRTSTTANGWHLFTAANLQPSDAGFEVTSPSSLDHFTGFLRPSFKVGEVGLAVAALDYFEM